MIDVLVVLHPGSAAVLRDAAQAVQSLCDVTAKMGARLRVCRCGPQALSALRALAAVQAVAERTDNLPSIAQTCGLDPSEQLFAVAWAAQGQKNGPRAGAGLDWDAPGFQPPGGAKR